MPLCKGDILMQNSYIFDGVRHAMIWATEHLRSKTFPKTSSIYLKERLKNQEDKSIKSWAEWREDLPSNPEEAMLLSMQVYRMVRKLRAEDQEVIYMKYWGDYHDKAYLKGALQIKEAMRQRGKHVRLNYRFSIRQIAVLKDVHFCKIQRALMRIEGELATHLIGKGLIPPLLEGAVIQNSDAKKQGSPLNVEEFRYS